MRVATAGLALAMAALAAGCGQEAQKAPPAASAPATVLDPVVSALAGWRSVRPQHLSVSVSHMAMHRQRVWTGNKWGWAGRTPEPIVAEAWVGSADRAMLAVGSASLLAFHASEGAPLIQVGVAERRRRSAVLRDGTRVDLGVDRGADVGWPTEAPPDPAMMGNDLATLLDLHTLAEWLAAVPLWSEWSAAGGGVKRTGMAKAGPSETSWGAVRWIKVALVLDAQANLSSLTVEVRREPERQPKFTVEVSRSNDYARGDPARWAVAFPLAALSLPDDVLGPSLPEGHPDIGDPAHETTTYVLRPDPGPVSPELERFLRARRVVR